MYTLRRISTVPNSAMKVVVDDPNLDDPRDIGMGQGGTFRFEPAGQDPDQFTVSRRVAEVVMGDPGMAPHFDCDPPLTVVDAGIDAQAAPEAAERPARRSKAVTD